MNRWIESLLQRWAHHRKQAKYDLISAELDTALHDSANLAIYIGRLNADREKLKREMQAGGAK